MPPRPSAADFQLRSRWSCSIPDVDLCTWLFGTPTAALPTKHVFVDAEKTETHKLSLGQCRTLVKRVANGLVAAGLKEGDRVLIFSGNNVYFPVFFLAAVAAGGIFTGANPSYTARELAFQLKNSGARFCFASEESIDTAVAAADEAGMRREDVFVFDDSLIIADNNGGREYWDKDGSEFKKKFGVRHWSQIVAPSEQFSWRVFSTREECNATAAINYSSGTTGVPKGVEITHRNYVSNAEQVIYTATLSPEKEVLPSRAIGILPMYHAFGQTYGIMINPKRGTISHITGKFDFVKFLEYLEKFQVTSLNCVPPIMVALAKHPAVEKFDLTAIRSIGCGAAPLSYDIMKEVTARVGRGKYLSVNQGWGMTEATCSVLSRHPDDDSEGSTVGELLPNCEAKVVDAETGTRDLPANVSGEVWIRAPNVCKGYYNNPKATAEIFTPDGWMRTGDIGYYDEHGKWYIIDRIKELIKVRGLQVAPAELEGILLEHPAVADAAVIGLSWAGDERPRAYVVRKPNVSLTADDVVKWIEGKCTRHKWITGGVVFLDAIPKNPSGKILRKALRERAKTEVVDNGDFRAKL